jgi:hypothetical protein
MFLGILTKMGCATIWTIFSLTHPVTLLAPQPPQEQEIIGSNPTRVSDFYGFTHFNNVIC